MAYVEDVFKLSGVPTYTFVEPAEYSSLRVALRTKGRGVIVEGPSGIGKTTAVTKVLEDLGIISSVLKLSARIPEDRNLIKELPNSLPLGLVVIDDFHRLDDDVKSSVADLLKALADTEDQESKLVIVGINRAGDALVRLSPDLNNRIETIRFETNSVEVIERMISQGELALNVKINTAEVIANECTGSLHIAQMLCYRTCVIANVIETQESQQMISLSFEIVRGVVFEELHRAYAGTAKALATGSKLRREGRAPYLYILHWLSMCGDWTLNLDESYRRYPEQKQSVSQVVDKGFLQRFLETNPQLTETVHFDPQTKLLSIEDPKFMFYIRNLLWSKFAREVGYLTIDFKAKYDFALSFAGSDREVAEAIYNLLEEREVSVFYDMNEQSRILATNVEDYLAPIYKSEARFVVAIMGPDYPNRIWTKFESDQFKGRFGDNSVIPIWFSDSRPTTFDFSGKVGGMVIDRNSPIMPQVEKVVDTLVSKLVEDRRESPEMTPNLPDVASIDDI